MALIFEYSRHVLEEVSFRKTIPFVIRFRFPKILIQRLFSAMHSSIGIVRYDMRNLYGGEGGAYDGYARILNEQNVLVPDLTSS